MTFTDHLPITGSASAHRLGYHRRTPTSIKLERNNTKTMPTPLHFKGDKKAKKRKRVPEVDNVDEKYGNTKALATASDKPAATDDDSWVNVDAPTDVSGPILIVLPSDPVTSLACDANGKVFTSEIENIVEGDASTAEPHDVRQVWVANRVAGTEGFSLKGHHGR